MKALRFPALDTEILNTTAAERTVVFGYTEATSRYRVSVFDETVALAARCAGMRPANNSGVVSSAIVMLAADRGSRVLEDFVPVPPGEREHARLYLAEPRGV